MIKNYFWVVLLALSACAGSNNAQIAPASTADSISSQAFFDRLYGLPEEQRATILGKITVLPVGSWLQRFSLSQNRGVFFLDGRRVDVLKAVEGVATNARVSEKLAALDIDANHLLYRDLVEAIDGLAANHLGLDDDVRIDSAQIQDIVNGYKAAGCPNLYGQTVTDQQGRSVYASIALTKGNGVSASYRLNVRGSTKQSFPALQTAVQDLLRTMRNGMIVGLITGQMGTNDYN